MKLSEIYEILVKTLLRKNKATESKSDKPSPEVYVIDATRENCAKRESLVAESIAIVLAARRQDNFTRRNYMNCESTTARTRHLLITFTDSFDHHVFNSCIKVIAFFFLFSIQVSVHNRLL